MLELAKPRSVWTTALAGGLLAGTLDILYAILFWWFRGVAPRRILQSVASGLLGKAAYDGGATTAVAGLVLHLFIACCVAAVFCLAVALLQPARGATLPLGALYGLLVYAVMNYLVLPLSAFPGKAPSRPAVVIGGLLAHVLLIGLPIAWLARRRLQGE